LPKRPELKARKVRVLKPIQAEKEKGK
jgi:hypothetical protein